MAKTIFVLTSTVERCITTFLGTFEFLFNVHRTVVIAQVTFDLKRCATDTTLVRVLVLMD